MLVKVIGKEYKEGVSKKNGKPYSATVAHVCYKMNGVTGEATEQLWVDNDFCTYEEIVVSGQYNVDRNRAGYLVAFDRVK